MIIWRMRVQVMLLYLIPVAIIAIAQAIPNHIRTGDRRYDTLENCRKIATLGSFWFIIFAAIFRLSWSSEEADSRDGDRKPEPHGFEVLPPTAKSLTDGGGAKNEIDTQCK